MSHIYTNDFFKYIEQGAFRSAREVAPFLFAELRPNNLLDVGCGRGAWAKVWNEIGVGDVHGVDGTYVDIDNLHIPPETFHRHDLARPFDLGRRFDMVTSLEVAEHLPPEASEHFVDTLVRHSDVVLFSAATLGQGGEYHVNERPLEYWRSQFARHGYRPYDFVRDKVASNKRVERWYRYNSLLYVNDSVADTLSAPVRSTRVPDDAPIPIRGDLFWRCRLAAVRLMPRGLVDWIAVTNAKRKVSAAARKSRAA